MATAGKGAKRAQRVSANDRKLIGSTVEMAGLVAELPVVPTQGSKGFTRVFTYLHVLRFHSEANQLSVDAILPQSCSAHMTNNPMAWAT